MHWLIYACILISSAVGIHVFSKLSKGLIDPVFAMAMTGVLYVLTAGVTFFLSDWRGFIEQTSLRGLAFGGLVALSIVVANFAVIFMYRSDAPISVAMPVTRFSAALIAVLIGVFIWREPFSLQKAMGFGLAVFGIFLLVK